MLSYCNRYGEGMKRVLKTFGPIPEFSGSTVEKVHQVRGFPQRGVWAERALCARDVGLQLAPVVFGPTAPLV